MFAVIHINYGELRYKNKMIRRLLYSYHFNHIVMSILIVKTAKQSDQADVIDALKPTIMTLTNEIIMPLWFDHMKH